MWAFKWLFTVVGLCGVISSAIAQTNDWHSVEKLTPGTSISVVKRVRMGCELVRVTGSELTCDRSIGEATRRYVFKQAQVREVRLEESERNQMITGALVGAVLGGVLGFVGGNQLSDKEGKGYARFYGIPIGAFVGGAIGHAIHRHGTVVYRRT